MSDFEAGLRLCVYLAVAFVIVGGIAWVIASVMSRSDGPICDSCGEPEWMCLNKRAMCPPLSSDDYDKETDTWQS